MTNWLITGGCGFIGSALVRQILQTNPQDYIRVLDNLTGGSREDLAMVCNFDELTALEDNSWNDLSRAKGSAQEVELVVGDIIDSRLTARAAQGMDCIVHLAANTGVGPSVQDPRQDMQSNVLGTLNMLEAARINNVQKFIFASSSAPVGETDPPVHENLAPHPVSPYGASKLAGEGYCSAYYHTFNIKTVALRFGNVYGPGSKHKSSVVAKFIKQSLKGQKCTVYGDGDQTRDFIYIDDLIQSILKAALFTPANFNNNYKVQCKTPKEPWGEIFQIATNKEHTVNEMAEMLSKELQRYNLKMLLEHGEPMRGDILRNYSDTTKAKEVLGWQSSVDLQQGLAETVRWFLGQ